MANVTFLGAAGEVTGSGVFLSTSSDQFLIDFGMFQGGLETYNTEPLSFDPSQLTAVFLTHAHLDHSGRLPILTKSGYRGKVYMTEATKQLIAIELLDAAHLMEEEHRKVLYTKEDVEEFLHHVITLPYDKSFYAGEAQIVLRDAGHILGSSSIELLVAGDTFVVSGDLGNTPDQLINPTEKINHADYVIMESTYGDRIHPHEDPAEIIQKEIHTIEETDGVLLIPAFSVERTQELLHIIKDLKAAHAVGETTKVFLDSPMAIEVTKVFENFPNLYNHTLSQEAKKSDPFSFPGLVTTPTVAESKAILQEPTPKVIIAGSGMMHGGRILHHAKQYLSDAETRVLLVGFQAKHTMGRELAEGIQQLVLENETVPVHATVTYMKSLSSHADQQKLLQWLQVIKGVKKVFLVHGEEESRQVLSGKIRNELGIEDVTLPAYHQTISL